MRTQFLLLISFVLLLPTVAAAESAQPSPADQVFLASLAQEPAGV